MKFSFAINSVARAKANMYVSLFEHVKWKGKHELYCSLCVLYLMYMHDVIYDSLLSGNFTVSDDFGKDYFLRFKPSDNNLSKDLIKKMFDISRTVSQSARVTVKRKFEDDPRIDWLIPAGRQLDEYIKRDNIPYFPLFSMDDGACYVVGNANYIKSLFHYLGIKEFDDVLRLF